jgi:Polyketide cyclase / dehydrase and lipid transport
MIDFDNTIDIARAPDEVYAYLVDLEHTPEWNWAITSTQKVTPGPVGIGTRFRQTRSVPKPAVEFIEISALDPGQSIEIAGVLGPFQARLTYELWPSPVGTRLVNRVELSPPVPLGPVGGLLRKRVGSSVSENLEVLKQRLELPAAPDHGL